MSFLPLKQLHTKFCRVKKLSLQLVREKIMKHNAENSFISWRNGTSKKFMIQMTLDSLGVMYIKTIYLLDIKTAAFSFSLEKMYEISLCKSPELLLTTGFR